MLALTVAAEVPDRIRAVYALNAYDYETRYGDGIGRGNWFANMIIGSLQIPVFGAMGAAFENRLVLGKIMAGGYADPRKLPADLLAEFDETGRRPNYRYVERKVLAGWRSWNQARELYSGVRAPVTLIYGDKDWSRIRERERTKAELRNARLFTLENTGHFSATVVGPRRDRADSDRDPVRWWTRLCWPMWMRACRHETEASRRCRRRGRVSH